MTPQTLYETWKQEQAAAQMRGWDFSHIRGRYKEEQNLPWNYDAVVRQYLTKDAQLLDQDTGGAEYLLSLGHPPARTAATEGWPPNAALCQQRLAPLGVRFAFCSDPAAVPFEDEAFDLILNRHGAYHPGELFRLLKPGGVFITQQVGADNDRGLVQRVLPGLKKPFPAHTLACQRAAFEQAGFEVLRAGEHRGVIRFYDVGAFVWFARVIEWEFAGFSVERCFEALLCMQRQLEQTGEISDATHRFLLVAQKPAGPAAARKTPRP